MKYTLKPLIVVILILLTGPPLWAQTVTIDQNVQRYLGTVSQLDRSRFFNLHSNASDAEMTTFTNDYNVGKGRQFYSAFAVAYNQNNNTAGIFPPLQGGNPALKSTNRVVVTDHPYKVFTNGINVNAAGDWAADYYKNQATVPEFYEPMNEPFVHAGDYYSGGWDPVQEASMRLQMSQLYNAIGAKIKATPSLANMKIIGYSSAWPEMERNDFGHWSDNQKLFMDEAGDNMDAFSTHLYDGINVTGQDTRRSGSNSEAVLDLIETYSFIKWGLIKPHAITEYGAIEQGYGPNYSDLANVQSVRSINHILFNLLERENDMAISIPFITDKSTWHINANNNYQPYGAVLWKPSNIGQPNPTGWTYTPRIHFYEMWRDVKGDRVLSSTDHPDIQVQAFADNNKLYVALNNLDDVSHTVNLNFTSGIAGFQNVKIKTLKIYPQANPVINIATQTTAPNSITLIDGETAVLEYTFASNISFNNAIRSKKYYTTKHLQAISANTPIAFTFNNVDAGAGFAKIRMSIGRKHNVTKTPTVTVNGTAVSVPTNWKGYDQANRTDFFGTIEIPVPANLLQASNNVAITFPDAGGRISSVVLEVQKYDNAPQPPAGQGPWGGTARTIPGTIEGEHYDTGGEGVAFHDTSVGNSGGNVFRPNENVDIGNGDGGAVIGWTAAGEWVEYTVNATAGTYDLEARVSAVTAGRTIVAKLDGVTLGTFSVPNTGAWTTYQTVTINNVNITGGNGKILRLEFPTGGLNLNWVKFNAIAATPETVNCGLLPTNINAATTYTFDVPYTANQSRDVVVELWDTNWIDQDMTTVSAGSGTAQVTLTLNNAPAAGSNYIYKVSIRPVGADWTQNIDACQVNNVTVSTGPTNLLANNGFETGDLTSWQSWGAVSVVNNNQNSGSYAVTVNGAGAPSQIVNVQPNTTYTLSAFGKVASSGQNIFLGVKDHDAPESATQITSTSFTKGTHTFTTGANATSAQVYFYVPNASYQAWGDDFALVVGSTASRTFSDNVKEEIKVTDAIRNFNFYPNPLNTNELTLELKNDSPTLIRLFNLQGKAIYQKHVNGQKLVINRTVFKANGVYLLEVNEGENVTRQKIIVQ